MMLLLEILLKCLLIVIQLTIGLMFAPAILGVLIGVEKIKAGNIIGGLIAIVIGIGIQALILALIRGVGNSSGGYSGDLDDEECPFCGSGATDGNHCYDCDEDY